MRLFLFITIFFPVSHLFSQEWNYYFGNLHAHTGFSDGNKDSLVSGIFSPAGSYDYARLSDDFDFLGISEHNHYSSANNPGFKKPLYQRGLQMAETATKNGFLALFGMEYGISSGRNGHVIIYGFDSLIGWENSVPGVTGNNYDLFNAKSDYDGLFRKVKNNRNAFCYLAHPYLSDYSSDGSESASLLSQPYNAAYDSAIVGVPLRSGLANSVLQNYNDYPQGNYFDYFLAMLSKGYHLGIGYDHDNHYTNFGRGNGGRLVILAEKLSKEHLVEAMQKRRFYGSDDSNARIDFTLNGITMGARKEGSEPPYLKIVHEDPDGENADSLKLWRGSANNSYVPAEILYVTTRSNFCAFKDTTLAEGKEYFYFAEIRQQDGQWIVTSPVWYTKFKTEATINPECEFNYVLNSFVGKLDISSGNCSWQWLSISDLTGRTLYWSEAVNTVSIDVSGFCAGVYVLRFSAGGLSICKKLKLDDH